MRFSFCPQCGARLSSRILGDEGPVPFCEDCQIPFFDLAQPCVLVLSLNDRNEVALLRQPDVSETHWVLVAGFNKVGETAEETAIREIREETGLVVKECRYIASYYRPDKNLLLMGFLAYVEGTLSKASPEVDDVRWVPFEEVPAFLRDGSTALLHYHNVRRLLSSTEYAQNPLHRSTPNRPRVSAAVLRSGSLQDVLMVKHRRRDGRTYWQLPGGGILPGETPEKAVLRELREETGLRGTVIRELFTIPYKYGTSTTFLVDVDARDQPELGYDPEEARSDHRKLVDVAWRGVREQCGNPEIDQLLRALEAEDGTSQPTIAPISGSESHDR